MMEGPIILNGSIASIKGFPDFSVYSASKAAVRSFARTWTVDLKKRNIRVNVLSPGTIDTPILDPLGQEAKDYFTSLIPRGTMGRPEEIATVALFLHQTTLALFLALSFMSMVERLKFNKNFNRKDMPKIRRQSSLGECIHHKSVTGETTCLRKQTYGVSVT